MKNPIKKTDVVYLSVTFLFTWITEILAFIIANKNNFELTYIGNQDFNLSETIENPFHILTIILFNIATFGPLIGAICVTFLEKQNFKNYIWKTKPKTDRKLIQNNWILVISFFLITSVITFIIDSISLGEISLQQNFGLISAIGLFFYMFFFAIGEETGWRGYLSKSFIKTFGHEKTGWILGIIWSVWHWPFLFYLYKDTTFVSMLPILLGNIMAMVPMTIIYLHINRNSKNILPSIIFHAMGNSIPLIIATQNSGGSELIVSITASWLTAAILDKKYKEQIN